MRKLWVGGAILNKLNGSGAGNMELRDGEAVGEDFVED